MIGREPIYTSKMPNLIRRNNGNQPPRIRYPILRDPGTRLSYRERDTTYSLAQYAGWTHRKIGTSLGIPERTISNALQNQTWTPQKQRGRKPKIDTPTRKRLVARAKRDRWHRQRSFKEIAYLEGISSCKRSLYKAFEKEGYFRRIATEKPLITPAQREARLK
jgi:transposase